MLREVEHGCMGVGVVNAMRRGTCVGGSGGLLDEVAGDVR